MVIPVHDGGAKFQRVLQALAASSRMPDEIIVVDDASRDSSTDIARSLGAQVLAIPGKPVGPAAARNQGANAAKGEILVFIDADVAVHSDTLALIEAAFSACPVIDALFGSYDDTPADHSLVSLYKNLEHHYVHQHSKPDASTFWAGCGAVRREVFLSAGGFDESFSRPSIEDIELGIRLKQAGYCIRLCPDIQATHLKRWTLANLLRSDIYDRAIPWTRLILTTRQMPPDLNLDWKSRLSAFFAWFSILCLGLAIRFPLALSGVLLSIVIIVILNIYLYQFFFQKNGILFSVGAGLLHILYFLYSSLAFLIFVTWHFLTKYFGNLAHS